MWEQSSSTRPAVNLVAKLVVKLVHDTGGSSSAFHNSNATKSSARRSKLAPEIFDAEEQLILDDIPELDYLTQIVFKVSVYLLYY